jgi:D-aspartate ligase
MTLHKFLERTNQPIGVVLGGNFITELGIIRSLAQENILSLVIQPVYGKQKKSYSFFSKYAYGIQSPHPRYQEKEYIDFLIEIGKKLNQKGVLYTTCGYEIIPILKHRELLEKYYYFPFSEVESISKINNKAIFYKILEEKKIAHPKTFYPSNYKELLDICDGLNYPVIIKPVNPSCFVIDFKKKLFYIETKEKLKEYFKKSLDKNHQVIIQEISPGKVSDRISFCAYFDRNHNPIAKFYYAGIRAYPDEFGNLVLIKSINPITHLEKITTEVVIETGFYGILEAEFKYDREKDIYNLIEINPRPWQNISLATRCKINLPYIAYCQSLRKYTYHYNEKFNKNIKWVETVAYTISSFIDIKNHKLLFNDWIKYYNNKKENAVLSYKDPIPTLVMLSDYIINFKKFLPINIK